jgi:SAM-dependent methyltransferase
MTLPSSDERFELLIAEGVALDVDAYWGAGFLQHRYRPGAPSWTWSELVQADIEAAHLMLDMGTGDGGALRSLAPLPTVTVAYEEWLATLPRAITTLRSLGVHLVVCQGSDDNFSRMRTRPTLPFRDRAFDVVLNRHEAFDANDVRRVLLPGGVFTTQQVGHRETDSVRDLLGLRPIYSPVSWDLSEAIRQVESAGFSVTGCGSETPPARFTDIAALIGYVRTTPWNFPDWDVESMGPVLREVHARCERDGGVTALTHRFWLTCR